MSKKYFYPVIFEPEEVGVSVYVPDIPGCNTQGDSLEEAFAAKTILEGLDREAPLMTKQEQLEVKEDIAYSLKLYDLHGR